MPLFFVISGYCISASGSLSAARRERPIDFLKRRLRRIYPPLWASMIVVVLLPFVLEGLSALHTGHFVRPRPAWFQFSASDWLGLATLGQVFFSQGERLPQAFVAFNAPYWTLAIEVQFYLVMYMALSLGRNSDRFLAIVTALAAILAFIPSAYNTGIFLPYWPLFAVGLILHRTVGAGVTLPPAIAYGVIAAALAAPFAVSDRLLYLDTTYPLETAFFFGLAFALFLWGAVAGIEPFLKRHAAALPIHLLALMGAASYSIYLLHRKLSALPAMAFRQVVANEGMTHTALTIVATIFLAWLFSLVVERRFTSSRHSESQQQALAQAA